MQVVEMLKVIKSIIHTFVRFMPLGIYFFCLLFNNIIQRYESSLNTFRFGN